MNRVVCVWFWLVGAGGGGKLDEMEIKKGEFMLATHLRNHGNEVE